MDKEEKYTEIREKLLKLEAIKASDDFVHNLHSKIVEIESEKRRIHEKRFDEGRGGFLKNLFGNMQYPWLVPAAGFTVLIFFIFYVTYLNRSELDSNQELLSTQQQETTSQQNSTSEEKNNTENEPLTSKEPENITNEKKKSPDENIAADLKTENTEKKERRPLPSVTYKEHEDNAESTVNQEETKTTELNKPDEVSDGRAVEKKLTESKGKNEISTSRMSEEKGNADSKEFSKSAESDDGLYKVRLKQKIDSLSKIDLKKLREEILK